MQQKPCPLCGKQSNSDQFRDRNFLPFFMCEDCGSYAITGSALEVVQGLRRDSAARLNLISYTMTTPKGGKTFRLLWKSTSEGELDKPEGLPKTIRNVEDVMSQPIEHSQKPDDILRLMAGKVATESPFDKATPTLAEIHRLKISGWR